MIGFQSKHDPNIENWRYLYEETREIDTHNRLESRWRATGIGARHSDARTLLTSGNTRRILYSRWRPGCDDHRRRCSRTLMRAIDPTNPAKPHVAYTHHRPPRRRHICVHAPWGPGSTLLTKRFLRYSFESSSIFRFLLRCLTSRVGISRLVQSSFRCIDRVLITWPTIDFTMRPHL